ncbi:MAG: tRNA glutamyl-Q(34) synthetase GluQRS [Rhodobacterales bacterium]
MKTKTVTRFAPSPTGPLHLGHAYAAIFAHDMASAAGGRFLLRIEDIDQSRARPEWESLIEQDLRWLGLSWETPVMRQSDRLPVYQDALQNLWQRGLIYPCHCTRRDILDAIAAPQEGSAPNLGPDGIVYPGTCRHDHHGTAPRPNAALRLNMARALNCIRAGIAFTEDGTGPQGQNGLQTIDPKHLLANVGDIVLARRDMGTSYHLSVVLDDAAQGITHITRGHDLFDATQIHVLLQRLFDLPTPRYHHHRLIRDAQGKRLAKRDDARAIRSYRADGITPDHLRRMIGL